MADRPIPYNDPFYFALPNPSTGGDLTEAERRIERRFGIVGKAEVMRSELAFTLWRLSDVRWASKRAEQVTA